MTPTTEHASDANAAVVAAQQVSAPAQRRLLSKAQVATRLGCCERSLERLVKHGRFPAPRRYGRAVVWFESVVEHVLGLAEQEQLQWQPGATGTARAPAQPSEPPAPSPIPAARELENEVVPSGRKARKAASPTKRREPKAVSAEELAALRESLCMPTV